MAGLTFSYHHAGVSVPDLDASIKWYGEVLGFELEQTLTIEAIPAKIAFVRNGKLRMELFEVPGAQPASPDRALPNRDLHTHGNKHIAFAVPDVHAVVAELRRRGADIVFVQDFEHGSNAFIRDNAGNLIEFLKAADDGGDTATL